MKTILVATLAVLAAGRLSAQISVELALDQEQFLPSETIPLAVKITNRSGQQLHLGADANWLTFSVESADGFVVIKNSDVPVLGEFDLESSQMATKRVDLEPYFDMSRPGRYKVTATLHIKDWSAAMTSDPQKLDVVNGAELWSQDFGVPGGTNAAPEVRKYSLVEANYLRSQLRLYVEVSDTSKSRVFKVAALGPLVSFSQPESQVDRISNLHVIWQAGAQAFDYCVIDPDGTIVQREVYDYLNTHPRLGVNGTGELGVVGGVRRPKPGESPLANPPVALPAPAPAPATGP
jgi:hypothetical protein